jgi:transcriptional regulator with XRE-family HTH domain
MKAQEITELRQRLGTDRVEFAKIIGVDLRSVSRWERGQVGPTGSSLAVMLALREKLDVDPAKAEEVRKLVYSAAGLGGLAYLILKLLNAYTDDEAAIVEEWSQRER